MSDMISRQDAIDYIKTQRGRPFIGITLEEAIIMMIEEVPSAEPETASNGSITCVKSEKMHVRTTDDCISRRAAIDAIRNTFVGAIADTIEIRLNDLPSAEPERKKGEWIVEKDCEGKTRTCICGLCGYKTDKYTWKNPNYCSNCGADMRQGEDDNV